MHSGSLRSPARIQVLHPIFKIPVLGQITSQYCFSCYICCKEAQCQASWSTLLSAESVWARDVISEHLAWMSWNFGNNIFILQNFFDRFLVVLKGVISVALMPPSLDIINFTLLLLHVTIIFCWKPFPLSLPSLDINNFIVVTSTLLLYFFEGLFPLSPHPWTSWIPPPSLLLVIIIYC